MIREEAITLPFTYAAGIAGSRLLTALRDERRILGSRCSTCERVLAPLRAFCPVCGSDELADVEIGPAGTVISWTDVPGKGGYVLVQLDGADTGMVHRLVKPSPAVDVGTRVRARFAAERTGSILDIEGFEPVEEAAA